MKKEKLRQEIRYHEGFPYIYVILPLKFRRKKEQLVKISTEAKHDFRRDTPEIVPKV